MPSATDDPISAFLRNIFDNQYQVIVAYNYDHCKAVCRENYLPPRGPHAPILISACDPASWHRFRGRRFEKKHVYVYYTARWSEYWHQLQAELRYYLVNP